MRVPVRAAILAMVLPGVAGCAPRDTNPAYSAADIGGAASAGLGTIVSMRPVAVPVAVTGLNGGDTDIRGNLLGAIGGVAGNAVAHQADRGPAVEFIVQEDAGPTVSVVQGNALHFVPGERVAITGGARARLARAGLAGTRPGGDAPPPPAGS